MDKETSSRVSSIASRLVHTTADTIIAAAQTVGKAADLADEIKTLAASCLSQDETPGQGTTYKPTFLVRLEEEREELSIRLEKLTSFLASDGFRKLPAIQRELLEAQRIHMGEYLHVLDARLADLGISQRSAPVETDTSFDPEGKRSLQEIADENAVDTGENSNAG